jgi:uncharacterized protein
MIYIPIVIVLLMVIYLIVSFYISGSIIHLNRQPVPKNPKDYGMDFEPVEFKTADGVTIKGWLIPGTTKKLVIQTHVGGLTKYGSTTSYKNPTKLYNKEVEFLKTAVHFHDAGYSVLMFDFRNHGESDPGPNKGIAGVGLYECQDVVAALNFVKARDDLKDMDIAFVSFCMGANSTIVAMSKQPEAFEKVKCFVAIQPISMEVFIRTYMKRLFSPVLTALLMPMVKQFVFWRGGTPLEDMSPRDYAKDIKVPALYIQARNDPWTELSDIEGFYNDTPEPKAFHWIEDTKHRFESYTYFQDRPKVVMEWLTKWL